MIAFGTYRLKGEECFEAVKNAITVGYRMIDTAILYKNHKEIAKAIKGIKRHELFIISKIDNKTQESQEIEEATKTILMELEIDQLDLLLLHSPHKNLFIDSWKKLINIRNNGLTKFIGVSNFRIDELESIKYLEKPYCNQIEVNPYNQRKELVKYCQDNGIIIQAYAPLARMQKTLLTPHQMLQWSISKGFIPIVTSKNIEHMIENLNETKLKLDLHLHLHLDLHSNLMDNLDEEYYTIPHYKDKKN